MNFDNLEGVELDLAVARALGLPLSPDVVHEPTAFIGTGAGDLRAFSPSSSWADGGPIIEREEIALRKDYAQPDDDLDTWLAHIRRPDLSKGPDHEGDTPLVAAMRALVASKNGG